MYSDALLARFLEPGHAGDVADPDGTGRGGNLTCGDVVQLSLRVADGRIEQIRFRAQGCATAIAAADAACQLVTGVSVTAARMLDVRELSEALGGIPPERAGCAEIVLEALRAALESATAQRALTGSG